MPTPIVFTLTNGGALDANTNGVSLTEIAIGSGKYTPLATRTALDTELARYPLSGGDVEPNSKTLRFSAVLESATTQQAFEVGLFTSTGELFAVASTTGADPLILVTANIAFVGSFGLSVSEIPAGSVTVVTDPSAPLAIALIDQHLAAPNPHPQYAMKAAFDSHVTQNTTEHSNFDSLITVLSQRISDLEQREEVQIGEFIITDDSRNPSVYKGYGDWRLVPNALLKGLGSGGTVGQFSQVAAGSDQSVRTTFFWQRFDPSAVMPLRTITISSDETDLNLLSLYIANYGQPSEGQRVRFIVEAGVFITASTTANHAITTGVWPPMAQLLLEVYGEVVGRGGRGGSSAVNQSLVTAGAGNLMEVNKWTVPAIGENGGGAILATATPLEAINHNLIAGGGGGGGGMGAWVAHAEPVNGGGTYADGIGAGGGAGGGAPFGERAPNRNTYEAYLLDPLFPIKGDRYLYSDLGGFVSREVAVVLFDQSPSSTDVAGGNNIISTDDFGSKPTDPNLRGDYYFPHYTDSSNTFYLLKTHGEVSKPIRMSQDATRSTGGLGGYGSSQNGYLYFTEQSSPADLSLNYGGRGGNIGQDGQSGVMQAFYRHDGSTKAQNQLVVHIPSADGGLAGIAITGPVTVTGNPVLGR